MNQVNSFQTVLHAAHRYLDLGIIPVPVRQWDNHKAPVHPDWQRSRPKASDLARLFSPEKKLNIGLLLGEASNGLIDIDLDCPEAITAASHLLPETGWVSGHDSRPRSHWWYRVDHPPKKANHKFTDEAGKTLIELRSTGGQTVAPPSIHVSGERIHWYHFGELAHIDLDRLQRAVAEVASICLLARHWPTVGTRQDAFLALTGGLFRGGWKSEQVERFLEALVDATQDEEGLRRLQTIKHTHQQFQADNPIVGWPRLIQLLGDSGSMVVNRIQEWLNLPQWTHAIEQESSSPSLPSEAGELESLIERAEGELQQQYQPFPIEALPTPLADFVAQGSSALGCDPAYLALPALGVVGGLLGSTRKLELKRTWQEPPVIWSLIVGDSGTRKSPAFRLATAPLYALQHRLNLEHQQALANHQTVNGDASEPTEAPTERILFTTDTTIEALAEILDDNPRGLVVVCDELTAWFGMFSRYQSGKQGGSDLGRWLSMHAAHGFAYHRKTGDHRRIFVPQAAVSVTGGIQPGVLARALTREYQEAGLAARLLMAMPPRRANTWNTSDVEEKVEQTYEQLLISLFALEESTIVHTLTPLAHEGWVRFYNEWNQQQQQVSGALAAAYSKLEGYAARFALIHHVVSHVQSGTIPLEVELPALQAGVTLCRWFAQEVERIYATLLGNSQGEDLRQLITLIYNRGGTISTRELMRANRRRYSTSLAAKQALDQLAQAKVGHWIEIPHPHNGTNTQAIKLCATV